MPELLEGDECFICENRRKSKLEKILAAIVECVSGKLVYQGAEDVLSKPAERLIFQDCYAKVGQGIPNPCTKLDKQKNLAATIKSISPTTQGKVVPSCIKALSTNESGNTLALITFGPKQLAVSVGKTEVKKPFFSLIIKQTSIKNTGEVLLLEKKFF